MRVWDNYAKRLNYRGDTDPKRDSDLYYIEDRMERRFLASLSFKHTVVNGEDFEMAVMETTEFDTKKIFAMPGKILPHGSLVEWSDAIWLITEVNYHSEFCMEGKMRQCNYNLKWIDDDGNIISRWCVVEDGTKYLIGEKSVSMMSIGDARIAVTIGKDDDTNKLNRGMRFLIDDIDSTDVLAYQITKPNKLFSVYDGKGVFRFILNEVNMTDDDNVELRIADYYSWKPKAGRQKSDVQTGATIEEIVSNAKEDYENKPSVIEGKKVWL